MDTNGKIIHLQISVQHGAPMQVAESIRAQASLGLEGDVHARQSSARQVLLMDEETLSAFELPSGRVRENITTRGIELKALAEGTRLRAGQVLLEITMPCAPCDFIEGIRPGLRAQMEGQRGMLARVIEGGEIRVGDGIKVAAPAFDSLHQSR